MSYIIVNPTDRAWTKHRYILRFGAYGDHVLMVYANGLGDALDECVDFLADRWPGLLADEAVQEDYEAAIAEGLDEEQAYELSTEDTTCAGNNGHYLASWEWGIVAEDPSREDVKAISKDWSIAS